MMAGIFDQMAAAAGRACQSHLDHLPEGVQNGQLFVYLLLPLAGGQ
jgi:hypothetical protein